MDFQPLRTNLQAAPHAGDLMSIVDLTTSERFLIFAARDWVDGACKGMCPTPTLVRVFAEADLSAALIDLHALLTFAATAPSGPLPFAARPAAASATLKSICWPSSPTLRRASDISPPPDSRLGLQTMFAGPYGRLRKRFHRKCDRSVSIFNCVPNMPALRRAGTLPIRPSNSGSRNRTVRASGIPTGSER